MLPSGRHPPELPRAVPQRPGELPQAPSRSGAARQGPSAGSPQPSAPGPRPSPSPSPSPALPLTELPQPRASPAPLSRGLPSAPLVPGSSDGGRSAGARPRHIATPGLLPARLAAQLPPGPEALPPALLGSCSPARRLPPAPTRAAMTLGLHLPAALAAQG